MPHPARGILAVHSGEDVNILSEAFLAGRRLVTAELASPLHLADLTAPGAHGFGITAELSAISDYTAPHAWSNLLKAAGFGGVRYHVRYDPQSDLAGVAWFGRTGRLARPPTSYSQELPAELRLAAAPFGVRLAGNLPAGP